MSWPKQYVMSERVQSRILNWQSAHNHAIKTVRSMRNEKVMNGIVCWRCERAIAIGQVVYTRRHKRRAYYHEQCAKEVNLI